MITTTIRRIHSQSELLLPLLPPLVPAAFTVRVVDAWVVLRTASVTVTVTVKLPAAVGVQLKLAELWEVQPEGNPVYAYP
jgi:hypothetical protein